MRITVGQAMTRFKLRPPESLLDRSKRRNAASLIRRRLGGRPRLEGLAYVAPPKIPPTIPRETSATAVKKMARS